MVGFLLDQIRLDKNWTRLDKIGKDWIRQDGIRTPVTRVFVVQRRMIVPVKVLSIVYCPLNTCITLHYIVLP